jgi:hypothetical protein
MPRPERARPSQHATVLALLAALTVAWTWPLARDLATALPGRGGDNFSFLWNFWWMRRAVGDPSVDFFRTNYLFYPFGTTIVDHTHTAFPALIGATLLRPLPVAAAHNLVLLAFVFANMACAYALAYDLTHHVRSSILAAVVYGCSPYLASHLLGHLDLVAAWVLPLFALLLGRALRSGSRTAAAAAGVVAAVAAYTAYYYVLYIAFLAVVYAMVSVHPITVGRSAKAVAERSHVLSRVLALLAVTLGIVAAAIAATGGTVVRVGPASVSLLRPQNALGFMWLCGLVSAAIAWMPKFELRRTSRKRRSRALVAGGLVVIVFLAGTASLVWRTAELVARREYVTQSYVWRSIPRGIDLLAPMLGHPRHPVFGPFSRLLYGRFGLDAIEAVGWLGIVPIALLAYLIASGSQTWRSRPQLELWLAIAATFTLVALGPILTVAGADTGLRLPVILFRYVPFVANARMPGRAIVGVFLALAMLLALRMSTARGWLERPSVQWALVALVAFDFWDAPIPITMLERPQVYTALAAQPPGGVCEVPFGIGDGLSAGVGSQDRRALYFATIHEHQLVGGYIARMPVEAEFRYSSMPIVGTLLRLSSGDAVEDASARAMGQALTPASPCSYLVLHRTASDVLRAYINGLPTELLLEDGEAQLYRVKAQ